MAETSGTSSHENEDTSNGLDFVSNILTPGSSMHPTFLLILDVAFASLLFVLLGMLVLTKGNFHVLALIAIEGCLWASVKWYIFSVVQEYGSELTCVAYSVGSYTNCKKHKAVHHCQTLQKPGWMVLRKNRATSIGYDI